MPKQLQFSNRSMILYVSCSLWDRVDVRLALCERILTRSLSEARDWIPLNQRQVVSYYLSFSAEIDNLAASAQDFRRGANRVRKQMWWKVCFIVLVHTDRTGYENALMSYWRCDNPSHYHHRYVVLVTN
jgi:hypothetical protein